MEPLLKEFNKHLFALRAEYTDFLRMDYEKLIWNRSFKFTDQMFVLFTAWYIHCTLIYSHINLQLFENEWILSRTKRGDHRIFVFDHMNNDSYLLVDG